NTFGGWLRPASLAGEQRSCGGTHIATAYFLLEPTNTNPKNNFPASKAFLAHAGGATYHLQNVALLPWYIGRSEGLGNTYSFPDAQALNSPAQPCPPVTVPSAPAIPTAAAAPRIEPPNGHQ